MLNVAIILENLQGKLQNIQMLKICITANNSNIVLEPC